MVIADVNVLVHAFRADAPSHAVCRSWLEDALASREAFGVSELVLSGVLRILTHPRVFNPPTPIAKALDYLEALRLQPNAVVVTPGGRHWEIFVELVRTSSARGNLVSDAYHAALAIEQGAEWITTDRDFSRFVGLRWAKPGGAR